MNLLKRLSLCAIFLTLETTIYGQKVAGIYGYPNSSLSYIISKNGYSFSTSLLPYNPNITAGVHGEALITFPYFDPGYNQTVSVAVIDSFSNLSNLSNPNTGHFYSFFRGVDDAIRPKAGVDRYGNYYFHTTTGGVSNTYIYSPDSTGFLSGYSEYDKSPPPGVGGNAGFAVNPSDSIYNTLGYKNVYSDLLWPVNLHNIRLKTGPLQPQYNFSTSFNSYNSIQPINFGYTDTSLVYYSNSSYPLQGPLSCPYLYYTGDMPQPELCFGLGKDLFFSLRYNDTIYFQRMTPTLGSNPYFSATKTTKIYTGLYYNVSIGSSTQTLVTYTDKLPTIAIDRTNGPHRGRIYLSYSAIYNRQHSIIVIFSDDVGSTWSSPVVASGNDNYINYFHELAVDQKTGILYVLYHKAKTAGIVTPPLNATNTFLAFSSDGGTTFQNSQISNVAFFDQAINPSQHTYPSQQQLGLAAYNGQIFATWPAIYQGFWQLTTATIANFNVPIIGLDSISCFQATPRAYSVVNFSNIPGLNYTWTTSAGLSIFSGQGTSSIQIIPNGSVSDKAETISVTIGATNVPSVTITKTIGTTLTAAPIAGNQFTTCLDQHVYSVVNPVAGFKYSWTADNSVQIISGQGTPSITVQGLPGTTSSTLTVTETGCNNHTVSSSINFFTNDLTQSASAISGPSQINTSSTASYSAPSSSTVTYLWSTSPGLTITAGQGTDAISVSSSSLSSNEYVNLVASKCGISYSSTQSVNTVVDSNLNWIFSRSFDENGPVAESKAFFDYAGKSLQNQTRNFSNGKVFAQQTFYDALARPAVNTLPAFVNTPSFVYTYNFAQNGTNNDAYNYLNFDLSKMTNPDPLGNATSGTLGWYFSGNNSSESGVAQTGYPFTQTSYYGDGTGGVKNSSGVAEALRMGSGHEVNSNSFPVINELTHYLAIRNKFFSGAVVGNLPSSVFNKAVQVISKNEDGKLVMQIGDLSGKTIMTARIGSSNILSVGNTLTLAAPANFLYFYLTSSSPITVTGGTITLENMQTEQRVSTSGNLPPGFYKAIQSSGTPTVGYANAFTDISYSFYNQLGQLIASIPPNGVAALLPQSNLNNYSSLSQIPFITLYEYDMQGRLTAVTTPDGGRTEYIYRKDGKIRFSQNAVQRPLNRFSYTNYDRNTRPIESGEYLPGSFNFAALKTNVAVIEDVSSTGVITDGTLMNWSRIHYDLPDASDGFSGSSAGSDIVLSAYDPNNINITATNSITLNPGFTVPAGSTFSASINASTQDFVAGNVSWTENASSKTWYSYDDQGRVSRMVQNINGLGTKTVDYTYDMLGNVLTVDYQKGTPSERFIHNYTYDADKRLKNVTTTVDPSVTPLQQANFYYYLHGPLKRLEIGNKLQGLDYTYTPQGWLKAINHSNVGNDPGKDGPSNGFAPDAFGMSLEYFPTDYVNNGNQISSIGSTYPSSYNGNVAGFSWFSNKTVASKLSPSPNMYTYTYDDKYQLNSSAFGSPNFTTNTFTEKTGVNKEYNLAYDPNGNIQTLTRSNQSGQTINNFTYTYQPNTNQLSSVSGYANYGYDAIGQMTTVTKSGKTQYVKYGVRGEVLGYYKDAAYTTPIVDFTYNELGYRIEKHVYASNLITYYVHDASGNLLAIYDNQGSSNTTEQIEVPVYASSRIGTYYKKGNNYVYELTDHLGSTRVVMNGTKLSSGNADITRFNDYYPYGSGLQTNQGTGYRYDYQGQYAEKDPETGLNSFELRMYDPVIGRWMRTDPAGQFNSPYEGMGNNPVTGTDPTGGEEDGWYTNSSGKAVFDASINSQQDLTNAGISGSYIGQTFSGYDASAGHWFSGDAQGNLSIQLPTVVKTDYANPKFDGSLLYTSEEINTADKFIYGIGLVIFFPAIAADVNSYSPDVKALQIHHFATNKNSTYTPKMEEIVSKYGLDLNGNWNKAALPHAGRHTNAYHDFVLRGMRKADAKAEGNTEEFLKFFDQSIIKPVLQDPAILYLK